jgi:predicted permease
MARRQGPAARVRFWLALVLDLRAAPAEWLSLPAFSSSSPSPRSPGATPVETFFQDLKYALRSFRTTPAATLVTALTIAIGIGATTTILSVANALLLRPPAGVVDTGSLVTVHSVSDDRSNYHSFSWLNYRDLAAAAETGLSDLAAFSMAPTSVLSGGEPELKLAMVVSGNYFQTLGVRPALGRFFVPAEDAGPGGPRVTVLGHAEWQARFNGDSAVVGKPILLNGNPFTIVGVAPPGFRGHIAALDASLWVPVTLDPVLTNRPGLLDQRGSSWLEMVGRLAPGSTRERAASALSAASLGIGRSLGDSSHRTVDVRAYAPLPAPAVLPALGFLGLLLLLAVMILLIASANVANVLLARAAARAREIAVRLAIGASRTRLVRQLTTESVLLFVLGGSGGTLLAVRATRALAGFRPDVGMPVVLNFAVDLRVLLMALGITLLTGVAFGLMPALQSTRPDLVRTLKDEPSVARRGRFRLRGAFVAAQVAGTTLLLVTAGLFVRALGRVGAIDLGFDPKPVQTLSLEMQVRTADAGEARLFAERLEERVAALPGVVALGLTDYLPLNMGSQETVVGLPGREQRENVGWFQTDMASVSPGYFAAMGMRLQRGRLFTAGDRAGALAVAIVNETLAERIWPGEDPVGKVFNFGGREGTPITVVGLAHNAKYRSVGEDPVPMVFLPFAQQSSRSVSLVVRMAPGASDPSRGFREVVRALDPALPIVRIAPLTPVIGVALLPNRVALGLAVLFGATGLLLAAVGLYGVLSFMVSRRRREIGIRMALGAAAQNICTLVLGDGLKLVAIGLGLGLVGAALVTRLLRTFLFGVSPLDPLTYASIALLFGVVGVVACLVPMRRALRTEPLEVLRHD